MRQIHQGLKLGTPDARFVNKKTHRWRSNEKLLKRSNKVRNWRATIYARRFIKDLVNGKFTGNERIIDIQKPMRQLSTKDQNDTDINNYRSPYGLQQWAKPMHWHTMYKNISVSSIQISLQVGNLVDIFVKYTNKFLTSWYVWCIFSYCKQGNFRCSFIFAIFAERIETQK